MKLQIWVLWLVLNGQPPLDLGEYLTEGRCQMGAALQMPYWQKIYDAKVVGWHCRQMSVDWRVEDDQGSFGRPR